MSGLLNSLMSSGDKCQKMVLKKELLISWEVGLGFRQIVCLFVFSKTCECGKPRITSVNLGF